MESDDSKKQSIKDAKRMKKYIASILVLMPLVTFAASNWQTVPEKSSIRFTATQNNAPVQGSFKKFKADIQFDLNQLSTSHVTIIVDINSLADPYNQLSDTLLGKDWFDAKDYPQAKFDSTSFKKTGDKTYEADGQLTMRDKTLPVVLTFSVINDSPTDGHIQGSTTIKRTAFGIGQGEWADTNAIKDDVKIDFDVTATKQN